MLGHLSTAPDVLRLHDIADHPSSVGFPANHPPMQTFLGVPVRARGAVFGNLYLTDKLGPAGTPVDFTARDEQVAVALAAAAGVAVGHARAYHQARQHELWLEAAAAASSWLTGGLPRDEALAAVLARVEETAGATGSALFGETDELPTALGEELAGVWPVLRELEDGTWALALPLRSGDRWVGALSRVLARGRGATAGPAQHRRVRRAARARARRRGRRRRTGRGWRSSKTASGSPGTCTTW